MKQFQYTIKDELGVHARPAGLLVKLAKQYTVRPKPSPSLPRARTRQLPLRLSRSS